MADATYTPKVYRKLGGEEFIVASSGDLKVESGGDLIIETGGTLQLDSGSSCTVATNIEMASGAVLAHASGSYATIPVTSRAKTAVATKLIYGLNVLTGTSTNPTYTMPAPVVPGGIVVVNTCSIGDAGTAVVSCSSGTDTMSTTGADKLTLDALNNTVVFVGKSATEWVVIKNTTLAFS